MKNSQPIYLVLGVACIVILLLFIFNARSTKAPTEEAQPILEEEIMDLETDTVMDPDQSQPLETTKDEGGQTYIATTEQGGNSSNTLVSRTLSTSRTVELFPGIFTLGTYYIDNINKKGVDACIGKLGSEVDIDDEDREYTKENFRINEIVYKDQQVFLMIESENIPEDVCAYIIQKPRGTSPYSALHLIVQ